MTDREAIRRLASLVSDLAAQDHFVSVEARAVALENELLADPPAQTVTREQAERVKSALAYYFDAKDFGAMGPDWPAFFRAVADALDKP